jgi:hypothetical protein
MARLRRQIEQEVPPVEQMPHLGSVADIGDTEPNAVPKIGDVGRVGT